MEPPTWHYPVRQHLGAVLLAAGRPADAERVYRADLEQWPENGWSLLGLKQALEAQGKTPDAAAAQQRFEKAWLSTLERGVADRVFRSDLDVRLTYRFVRDTVWVAASWYRPGGQHSPEEIAPSTRPPSRAE